MSLPPLVPNFRDLVNCDPVSCSCTGAYKNRVTMVYRSNMVPTLYGDFIGYELIKEGDPYPWGLRPVHFPSNKPIWFVLAIPNIENPKRKVVLDLHGKKVESSESTKWYHNMHAKMMSAVGNLEELGFGMSSSMKTEDILQRFVHAFYYIKVARMRRGR
ncbi:hypothetical protein Hanom_Chr10g00893511 [Helianthus anomalus]